MIGEWWINLGTGIVSWFGSLMSGIELPDEFTNSLQTIYTFLDHASGLGIWTPWLAIGISAGASLAVFGISATAMGVRQAAKHIPFIGGGG